MLRWWMIKNYNRVSQHKWYAKEYRNTFYAVHDDRTAGGRKLLFLHLFVLRLTDPRIKSDHKNHDGLDCRRYNLRKSTNQQNGRNRIIRKGCSSRYKGVAWGRNKWMAYIQYQGKLKHLGVFVDEKLAALAYDAAARKYFGKFAFCNFVPEVK